MALGALQFAAFLSYSRQDKRLARWLVRELEGFVPPRQTAEELAAKKSAFAAARPIFRDEYDMPVGGAVPDRLAEVIDASASMIVLCTPASIQSEWVNKEIRLFAERHPERKIIAVVGEGDPDSSDCYPLALRALGEPLAADLRDPRNRRQAVVKIAAAILGVDPDQLVGRTARRSASRRRWFAIAGSAAAVLVIALGSTAAVMSINARQANALARQNVEKLLTDTRAELDEVGILKAKVAAHELARTYFDGKGARRLNDDDLRLKAEWLRQGGEDALKRGDAQQALAYRLEAYDASIELLSRDANDPEALFSYAQSAYWMGEYYYQQGTLSDARPYWEEYREKAEQLLSGSPDYPDATREVHYARVNMGVLALEDERNPQSALESFSDAIEVLSGDVHEPEELLNLSRGRQYYVDALAQYAPASDVLKAVHDWEPLLEQLAELPEPSDDIKFHLPIAQNRISVIKRRAGAVTLVLQADRPPSAGRDPENAKANAATTELRVASGGAQCASLPPASQMAVTDRPVVRLVGQCLPVMPRAEQAERCTAFVDSLKFQPDRLPAELIWALFLTACSKAAVEAGDTDLSQQIEGAARERFFRWRYEQLSLPTQFQLAGFRTLKTNAWIAGLNTSLGNRGWIIEES